MGKNVSRKYQKIRYDKANFTNKQIRDLSDLIDTYFNINELYLIDQYRYMRKHGEPELYYEWLKRFKVENFYYLCEGRITVGNISKTILTTILGYTYMSLLFLPHNHLISGLLMYLEVIDLIDIITIIFIFQSMGLNELIK